MGRDIITNKWILGAVGLLIIVAGGCYFYYAYTTAQHKKAAAELDEFVRQWEKDRKAQQKRSTETEQAAEQAPAESNMQSADKPEIETNSTEAKDVESAQTQSATGTSVETAETADVPVSPHGFGPFPKVPADFPYGVVWLDMEHYERLPSYKQRRYELLDRVFVKLWSEGKRNFAGGTIENDKVYPHFFNTYYIIVEEQKAPDGTLAPLIKRVFGGNPPPADIDLLNPPPHIQVLDFETAGIDPFQYLNLP